MYQTISEKIEVAGVYQKAKFFPKKFYWKKTLYQIEEITFTADVRNGAVLKRIYSVVVGSNVFRLCFDRSSETWSIEEIWCE